MMQQVGKVRTWSGSRRLNLDRERDYTQSTTDVCCVRACVCVRARVCVHVTFVCECMYAHVFIYKYTGYCTCVRTVPMYSTPYNGTF